MFKFVVVICVCGLSVVAQNQYNKEPFSQFELDCEEFALEEIQYGPWLPTYYEVVTLENCAPPDRPYAEVLKENNVTIGKVLQLHSIPANSYFGAHLLKGLPKTLELLLLESEGGVLHLEKDALSHLPKIKSLQLFYVQPAEIPADLDSLHLRNTEVSAIPSTLDVKSLTIDGKQPVTIESVMPSLRVLNLHAPVPCFLGCGTKGQALAAPILDVIQLGMSTENSKNRTHFPMPDEVDLPLTNAYSSLRGLVISGVQWDEVPSQLLIGGGNMEYFIANDNSFATLPEVLFSDTRNMVRIDLSNNGLRFLPRNIFYWVTKLQTLKLQSNLLSAYVLAAIVPLKALKNLYLDDNPLGDICDNAGWVLLNLRNIELISLRRTKATRICKDWIQQLPNLVELRLEGNNIKSIACSDLRGPVTKEWQTLYIFLDDNPTDYAVCSRNDFDRDSTQSKELKKLRVQMSSRLNCDGGSYWLWKWLRLKVYVTVHEPFGTRRCRAEWQAYEKYDDKRAHYKQDCFGSPILCYGWSAPIRYREVSLYRCSPLPSFYCNISYVEDLAKCGVLIGEELHIHSVPGASCFGPEQLRGIPDTLRALTITGDWSLVRLEERTLAVLPKIKHLNLHFVETDMIPNDLDSLQLSYVFMTPKRDLTIPEGTFNAKSLTIVDQSSWNISGVAPRLRALSLSAPVEGLFGRDIYEVGLKAKNLEVIKLGSGFPIIPDDAISLPEAFGSLRGLELFSMNWREVPDNLLRRGYNMKYIIAKHNSFKTLPDQLFSSTPNMELIDFSKNKIENLPSQLFVGLKKLKVLNLASNQLTANVMEAIAPVTSLRELYLDENPLGLFCQKRGSILNQKELIILSLESVKAKHVCEYWLRELPKATMRLQENDYITAHACSGFKGDVLHDCTAVYSRP